MELIGLISNLKAHEMEWKAREEMTPQKKKMIAFKSIPTIFDEDDEEDDDEDLSLLVKNMRRMYNKAKFNNRRRWQGKEEKRSFTSIAESRDTLLQNARKPKVSHLPQRTRTRRGLPMQHKIQRVNPKKRWTRLMCISWLMITHPRYTPRLQDVGSGGTLIAVARGT